MIQMNRRERLLSIALAGALGVWAVWAFAIEPMRERIRTLERILPEKQTQVQELQEKGQEYVALEDKFKGLRARLASQDPSFQLLPFLEAMIQRHKLAGHVPTMRPDTVQP
ncbi:MAG: type II secretion system protein GspM, partial [Phycisphaerales bacterium]